MLFASCESMTSDVEIPDSKTESKVVIISYISPEDSIIKVKLFKSAPYFNNQGINNDDLQITDGTIELSDGTVTKNFNYNSSTNEYICTDPTYRISAGTTYTLVGRSPDGKSNRATCQVVANKVSDYSITLVDSVLDSEFSYGQIEYVLDYTIPDIPNEANYYRLVAYNPNDSIYIYNYTNEFLADENLDGKSIKGQTHVFLADTVTSIDFYLLTCDKAYYDYHQSYMNSNFGDPFSEPTFMYSNTENGMGVFASYRWSKKTFQIK